MKDITERLRSLDLGWSETGEWFEEAADEIVRLRKEREIISEALNDANDYGMELHTENKWLRKALKDVLAKEYVVDCKDVARAALKEGE